MQIGERLFLETWFAEHTRTQLQADVNAPLVLRDPTMDETVTTGDPLPGPFRGAAMNCRACHLVALFKTPSLRDLGHSGPYLHTGQQDTLEDVIGFYGRLANLARAGSVRNADSELAAIALTPADRDALAAFLGALDEDYE